MISIDKVSIEVNGLKVILLQEIKDQINTLDVTNLMPGFPKTVNYPQEVASWLYNLSQRAESISYNGILMTSADVDRWRQR